MTYPPGHGVRDTALVSGGGVVALVVVVALAVAFDPDGKLNPGRMG